MTEFVDIFEIFSQYEGKSPKSLQDMPLFEEHCIEQGFTELAEWLFDWRTQIEYQVMSEWELHDESVI